ncbi:hypothetical protein QBC45DRAFT_176081 [Copromyces sp. CBS 386.78]|nr:hypothetical protein QBC45DRAFT_176081 [Copromyces sp. CBS 386.78]
MFTTITFVFFVFFFFCRVVAILKSTISMMDQCWRGHAGGCSTRPCLWTWLYVDDFIEMLITICDREQQDINLGGRAQSTSQAISVSVSRQKIGGRKLCYQETGWMYCLKYRSVKCHERQKKMQHAGGRGSPDEPEVEGMPTDSYSGSGLLSADMAVVILMQLPAAAIMRTLISDRRQATLPTFVERKGP